MTERTDQRDTIAAALAAFAARPLAEAARGLFAALGYASDRRVPLATPKAFIGQFDAAGRLTDRERETLQRLASLHLLFQLTDAELTSTGDLFDDPAAVQTTQIHSYLFFAAELPDGHYTRTDLSAVARALNKPLPMPALLLLKHGDTLSLAVIHRRLNKRDAERDVLEKATLIKDIRYEEPIRAHLEILNDFALANLDADFGVANFVALHNAWQRRLGSYTLSNDFYREIADWYFWAHHLVENGTIRLPQHCDTEQEKSLFLIRLLTRVIFCWFLVEKRLIPADLFRDRPLKKLIKDFKGGSPQRGADIPVCDLSSTYYHAVLQNLFFGTLNMPGDLRGFREKKKGGQRYDPNYGITNLWRYETDFLNPADWLKLAESIPFLNGGLFDCLDDKSGKRQDNFILDGFSDNPDLACRLPNDLFFGPERNVDLSKDYGEEDKRTARSKRAKVRGLIEILSRYKFTIEENTPLEEEIALDPELLGKVFENLLASYNEDTQTTARKALGAFYTPREIVTYMVDEALKSYLHTQCPSKVGQTFLSASSPDKVTQSSPSASSSDKVVHPLPCVASSDKVGQTFLSATSPDGLSTSHRRLPHWHQDGAVYWITFRLSDSLPQDKLRAWKAERDAWRAHHPEPWSDADWKEYDERFGERLEAWLDAGMGSRALARPDVRNAVKDCLSKFDGERLSVHAAVIMPTHLHALIEPLEGQDLSKLLKGIKGASAREANKLLKTSGTFWLDESYDHIVRSEAQYRHFLNYIAENPVKAKLPASDYWLLVPQGGADIPACASQGGADIPVCASNHDSGIPACASPRQTGMSAPLFKRIDALFSTSAEQPSFTTTERDALIAAIGRVKILDPACGSGAFPMGALHRLVDLLQKLDPNNELWKRDRLAEAERYCKVLEETGAPKEEIAACHARIEDITKSFDSRFHALDFARKLYLIENGIYGVDIQPVAVQIAKLRFFISLMVDQKVQGSASSQGGAGIPACASHRRAHIPACGSQSGAGIPACASQGGADIPVCGSSPSRQTGMSAPLWNCGVRPLPNLETKFVAADTLIPIPKAKARQANLFDDDVAAFRELQKLKDELKRIRHEHFNARDPGRKRHWRDEDQRVRETMRDLLRKTGMPSETAKAMSAWDPYDQNAAAAFFDSEWMFGLKQGGAGIPACGSQGGAGIPACDSPSPRQTGMSAPLSRSPQPQGPFDIVIGNPPYIRIQTLKKKDPKLVEFYKDEYDSAAKGNYDLYVVFIEAGLRFLKLDGHLAYILPHKFFNAQYGEPIRELIANGKHLRHVVHFGDAQVFPGATIYTCLLFLTSEGSPDCRYVKAHNLEAWKARLDGAERRIKASEVGKADWNFVVGNGANVFERLQAMPTKLVDVASRISQGIRTSANEVFVLDLVSESKSTIKAISKQLADEVELEIRAVRLFLQGREIKPYAIRPSGKVVIIPYRLDDHRMELIPFAEISRDMPSLAHYLSKNRAVLIGREDGKMTGSNWHGFVYPKNLDVMLEPKLIVPDIADRASFGIDSEGSYAFTSGYGITFTDPNKHPLKFMLGLCNSQVLDFYWRKISTPLRGGYFRYFTQFIEQLPIANATEAQREYVTLLTEHIISLKSLLLTNPADQSTRDPLMLAYFEQILNGLVYELYFPEEVHGAGLHLFDLVEQSVGQAFLPAIPPTAADTNVCATFLPRLRTLFETLYDGTHPIRIALDKLQTLDTVRIIERKA